MLKSKLGKLLLLVPVLALVGWTLIALQIPDPSSIFLNLPVVVVFASIFLFRWPFVFPVVTCLVVPICNSSLCRAGKSLEERRGFFGVVKVRDLEQGMRIMVHGTTVHGGQDPKTPDQTLHYYHRAAPIGEVFERAQSGQRLAVIGLGTGCLAALTKPDQELTFFEIDPLVDELAARWFSYLPRSHAKVKVVLGDGRLRMQEVDDDSFDVILLDAFTSDAIPAHLVTLEAMQLYVRKLTQTGVLAVHISNRHIDLQPVLRAAAAQLELAAIGLYYSPPTELAKQASASRVVLLSRSKQALEKFTRWKPLAEGPRYTWTDDHFTLLPLMNWPAM